jgi:hypothetical protein
MRDQYRLFSNVVVVSLFVLLAGLGMSVQAHSQERMTIQANARGTSTQLGKLVPIVIRIDGYSTQADRETLVKAFNSSGQNGLVRALNRLPVKGRIGTPYGVGNDVNYIIELPPEQGRRHIRLVTARRMTFGELWAGSRSTEYSVGAVDLYLTPDGKGSEGTVLPACRLTVKKNTRKLEVEVFQNPWKLTQIRIYKR